MGDFSGVLTHYKDRVLLSKIEYKALRWACEFLMPVDELLEACRFSHCLDDIAKQLEVPHHMLKNRLEFLSKETDYISKNGINICLYGGNFHIYHNTL